MRCVAWGPQGREDVLWDDEEAGPRTQMEFRCPGCGKGFGCDVASALWWDEEEIPESATCEWCGREWDVDDLRGSLVKASS